MVSLALAMMLAITDDPRFIAVTDAKTAPLTLSLAKRCHIKATTRPLPPDPTASIKLELFAVMADKPIKQSDPRVQCYYRLIRKTMPALL